MNSDNTQERKNDSLLIKYKINMILGVISLK